MKLDQLSVDQITGQVKTMVLMMLNETADEFDARELTPEQRYIYNEFTGAFGQKVLNIRVTLEGLNDGIHPPTAH